MQPALNLQFNFLAACKFHHWHAEQTQISNQDWNDMVITNNPSGTWKTNISTDNYKMSSTLRYLNSNHKSAVAYACAFSKCLQIDTFAICNYKCMQIWHVKYTQNAICIKNKYYTVAVAQKYTNHRTNECSKKKKQEIRG